MNKTEMSIMHMCTFLPFKPVHFFHIWLVISKQINQTCLKGTPGEDITTTVLQKLPAYDR